MYINIGADSNEFDNDLILIPIPACAPVDSAASNVVSAAPSPRRTAVIINGTVAGQIIFVKITKSFAPKTLAALIIVCFSFSSPCRFHYNRKDYHIL